MSATPINQPANEAPAERRQNRRLQVLLPVEVEIAGERRFGQITNLSRAGARIDLRGRKSVGETLVIRRAGVAFQAQIVWAEDGAAGLWFPEPLDENSFLRLRARAIS